MRGSGLDVAVPLSLRSAHVTAFAPRSRTPRPPALLGIPGCVEGRLNQLFARDTGKTSSHWCRQRQNFDVDNRMLI